LSEKFLLQARQALRHQSFLSAVLPCASQRLLRLLLLLTVPQLRCPAALRCAVTNRRALLLLLLLLLLLSQPAMSPVTAPPRVQQLLLEQVWSMAAPPGAAA
jgi:hypothetical protein